MNENKKREKRIVEFLKEKIKGFPSGNIKPSEKPDFLISRGDSILGIEVTELHKKIDISDPESKANESVRSKIVKMLKEKLILNHIENLTITIHFSHTRKDFQLNRENFSEKLLDIILSNIPDKGTLTNINHYNSNALPYEIDSIDIADYMSDYLQISHPTVGWVQDDFRIEMQNLISQKNLKLKEYYTNCDECWLVIYSNWDDASTFLDPNKITKQNKYNSLFTKTFYIGGMPKKCIQLITQN